MNEIAVQSLQTSLVSSAPQYKEMMDNINSLAPAIKAATANFHKSHSQFMGVTLDVTAMTPIRSIKHSLAEAHNTRMAIEAAVINLKKKDIEIRRKQDQLKTPGLNPFDAELLETEIVELQIEVGNLEDAVSGAVRKLSFFSTQFDNLLKKLGKTEISEEEYEAEETKYHIMTCMKQALNAARARGGIIDEGNLIYLFDLGVPAAQAQAEVLAFLEWEVEELKAGRAPTHEATLRWLEALADKWKENPRIFTERRGFSLSDAKSLLAPVSEGIT